jgi:Family of unknown function (DUF5677)
MMISHGLMDFLAWVNPKRRRHIDPKLKPYLKLLTKELELIQYAYFGHKDLLGKDKGVSTKVHLLTPLLYSIQSNAYSLAVLVNQKFVNESYILIRALYERCLNYCYLVAAPDDEYVRWAEHSLQKSIRLLRKELVVGNLGMKLEFSGLQEIWDRPQVAEILKQYQRKNSTKEDPEWSKLARRRTQRIEWLSMHQTDIPWEPFALMEIMFFDEASEAVHGTFYGTVFHKGFFEPKFQEKGKLAEEADPSSLLIGASVIMLDSVLRAAHLRLPTEDLISKSRDNAQSVARLLKNEIANIDISEVDPMKRILKVSPS